MLSNDLLVAVIAKEKLSDNIRPEPKNVIGKLLQKVMPSVGLTLRFESGQASKVDSKIIMAGMTLLQVHDITGVNR